MGFLTRGVRTGYEKLMHTELPAILHWKGNHFVVLFKTAKDQVRIADPAVGIRKLSRKEFEAEWTGVALLLEYTDQVAENEPSREKIRKKLFESYLQREMKRAEITFPFNVKRLTLE